MSSKLLQKYFFTEKVIKDWKGLPRAVVISSSLGLFIPCIDLELRDMA